VAGLGDALIPHAPTPSFPSDHATGAYALVFAFALARQRFDATTILLFTVACVIGLFRVFVGVHYPTDIFGGLILALAVSVTLAVCMKRLPYLRGHLWRR